MCRRHKKVCITLNYIEHFLILASTIIGCILVSALLLWLAFLQELQVFVIGLKICAIAAGIKMCKSIIIKKKNKHDK